MACYLDDMPHKRLTRPERVFEFFFSGVRAGRGRENILRLEVPHLLPCACQPTILMRHVRILTHILLIKDAKNLLRRCRLAWSTLAHPHSCTVVHT